MEQLYLLKELPHFKGTREYILVAMGRKTKVVHLDPLMLSLKCGRDKTAYSQKRNANWTVTKLTVL
jgi:hypothetical protein